MEAKEMDMSIQTSFADERWYITIQAWVKTQEACDKVIRALEILKPFLSDNDLAQTAAESSALTTV